MPIFNNIVGRFWKYYIVLLLGIWFTVCSRHIGLPVAYDAYAKYNYQINATNKTSHFFAETLPLSRNKNARQSHRIFKRWLKENDPFIFFDLACVFSVATLKYAIPTVVINNQFFFSATHTLISLRGPPQY